MKRIAEVRARRERLIARAEEHRQELRLALEGLRGPLLVADRAAAAVAYVRARPALVAGVVALAIAAIRARNVVALAKRGFVLWRRVRTLRTIVTLVRNNIHLAMNQRRERSA